MNRSPRLLALSSLLLASCDPGVPPTDASVADAPPVLCASDEVCDDGLFCNGEETCVSGICAAGAAVVCDDGLACTASECSEARRTCVHAAPDADGDGFGAATCGDGTDCDDTDGDVFPGQIEVCDAVDDDCDPTTLGTSDIDRDGVISGACCNPGAAGAPVCGADCDDTRATSLPGGVEVCDRLDQDCDGTADEEVDLELYADRDRDGVGAGPALRACAGISGTSARSDDCDDTDFDRYPDGPELCDARDNDCDEVVDEETRAVPWYTDGDGDGFGALEAPQTSCIPIEGRATRGNDCDDDDAARHPAAAEACDGLDNDCNGLLDFAVGLNDWEDDDGDGIVDALCPGGAFGDCDDDDPRVGAGNLEICDGSDNDCDEAVDEGVVSTPYYRDVDADGYGSEASGAVNACATPAGFSSRGGDCSDHAPERHPDAEEVCNGADDDCDAAVDEACVSGCEDPGEVSCGGRCIDPVRDERYCGAAGSCGPSETGARCDPDQLCAAGDCADAFVSPNGEGVVWGPTSTVEISFAVPRESADVRIHYTYDGTDPLRSATADTMYGRDASVTLYDGETLRWVIALSDGVSFLALPERRYTHRYDPTATSRPGLIPGLNIASGPAGRTTNRDRGASVPLHAPLRLTAPVTVWRGAHTGPVQAVMSIDGIGTIACMPLVDATAALELVGNLLADVPGLHAIRVGLTYASGCASPVSAHPASADGLMVGAITIRSEDCSGVEGGSARVDNCDVCRATPAENCLQDCAGTWGGAAVVDACGTCDADPANDCAVDCDGVIGGSATLDVCGRCVGGTTSLTACPTVTLEATADATINSNFPTSASGGGTLLVMPPWGTGEQRVLVRFDLSGIPGGVTVAGARLSMTAWRGWAYGGDGNVYVRRAADGWSEAGVTWDTRPAADTTPLGAWWIWYDSTIVDRVGNLSSAALTSTVISERANDGVLSVELSSLGYETEYRSREHGVAAQRPTLTVGYLP